MMKILPTDEVGVQTEPMPPEATSQPSVTARSQAQAEAARRNGMASTGPKTEEGKRRSSVNRLLHGLEARALLLPGEEMQAYTDVLEGCFETYQPTTDVEAMIVAEIGDAFFRLRRLHRHEHGQLLAGLEEELKKTDAHKNLALALRAQTAVTTLIAVIDDTKAVERKVGDARDFLAAIHKAEAIISEVPGLPHAVQLSLAKELEAMGMLDDEARADFSPIRAAAALVAEALEKSIAENRAALDVNRKKLSTERLLLHEREIKLIDRYSRTIEQSISRQVGLLAQGRQQGIHADAGDRHEIAGSGSFRQPFNVSLRVIK